MKVQDSSTPEGRMQLGIFATVFQRATLEETLAAVRSHGLETIQFDMVCAGLPEMPDYIEDATSRRVRSAASEFKLDIAALSGMYNMIHPELEQRRAGMRRLGVLIAAAPDMGIKIITLCTGTRDPINMWRRHAANDDSDAWADVRAAMTEAVELAEKHDVVLAFEPEVANVVDSAQKARRLLDEVGSPHLKVVFDGANIFHKGELPQMREMLTEAVDLLAKDIVIAHAKDLDRDGEAGHLAAGKGLLDYGYYLGLLEHAGFTGPILLHGLSEDQVDGCKQFMLQWLPRGERHSNQN